MPAEKILIVKHVDTEGPGLIEECLKEEKLSYQILSLPSGPLFPKLDDIGSIILLGGPMNVYQEERYPFLRKEDLLIKEAIQRGRSVLGICLGAQLIAKALGARIVQAPHKEVGWYEVSLTEEGLKDALFSPFPKRFPVFQWHEDTFEIPGRARLIATSDVVPNQAFGYGEHVYGIQFHLEMTQPMIEEWMKDYEDECEPAGSLDQSKAKILAETMTYIATSSRMCLDFFRRFLKRPMGLG